MGLGIFIAQSLLERTGARLSFANLPDGGAEVVVEWPRAAFTAMETRAFSAEADAGSAPKTRPTPRL